MRSVELRSRHLPADVGIFLVEGWPPDAFQRLGPIVRIPRASCRGASLIRARKVLRQLGML